MKKLLIIGANPETMGIKIYVTDYNKMTYAKKFADVAFDVDGLVKLVKNEHIDALLVGVAEALIPTYCKVCEVLDYPCFVSMNQFETMISKDNFKNTCHKYNVPVVPKYSFEDVDKIEYPVIVKPVYSSSSKGISICQNCQKLDKAIEKALSFSFRKKILIENIWLVLTLLFIM